MCCQISSFKISQISVQYVLPWNLVKLFFNQFGSIRRSFSVGIESESDITFGLAGKEKQKTIRCQISSRKNSMVFQQTSCLKLAKDSFNCYVGLKRSVNIEVERQSE